MNARPLYLSVIFLSLALCGCRRMTNDEIIRETKKCKDAGLNAEDRRGIDGTIYEIQCGPKTNEH